MLGLLVDLLLNLLGCCFDIVVVCWQVEVVSCGVDVVKVCFYLDINLSVMIGFDSLVDVNFFMVVSKSIVFGLVIMLLIFEGGVLWVGFKGEYVNYELVVVIYNKILNDVYVDVVCQIVVIYFIECQLLICCEVL